MYACRVPVQSVEIQDASGNYVPLTRTSDNYFQGGGFNFPANVRITSILGESSTLLLQLLHLLTAQVLYQPCKAYKSAAEQFFAATLLSS